MVDFKELIEELAKTVAREAGVKAAQEVLSSCPISRRYFSPMEASTYMGLSVDLLYQWRQQMRGPRFRKLTRVIRYDVCDIDSWMCGLTPGLDGKYVNCCGAEIVQDRKEVEL